MGLEFVNLSHRFGYQSPNWPYFGRRQDRAYSLHGEVRRALAAHHDFDAQHHTHRRAGARHPGDTFHRRKCRCRTSSVPASWSRFQRKKWQQITYDDLEKAAGKIVRPPRCRDRQHRLASQVRGQRRLFLPRARLRAVGGRMVRREEGPRSSVTTLKPMDHPLATAIGPAAQWPAASAFSPRNTRSGRKVATGRTTSRNGSPSIASCSRNGILGIENIGGDLDKGHRTALHIRVLSVELGSRRRLHHSPCRHHRSEGGNIASNAGGEILMLVKKFARCKRPTKRPNHRACHDASAVRRGSRRLAGARRRGLTLFAGRRRGARCLATGEGLPCARWRG